MTPQERRQTVIALLDHWHDFFELADSGRTTLADPSRPMPADWTILSTMSRHPSVLELGRLLAWLRDHGRAHYGCVLAYFDAPWRTTVRPRKRRDARGRWVVEDARVRERVLPRELGRHPGCRCGCGMPRPVCLAVDVLAGAWSREVPLELPWPLLAKLRPLADGEGWTEAA